MYQPGLGTAFSAEEAAKPAHRRYVIPTGPGTFAGASEDIARSLDFGDGLPQRSCVQCLELMHSTLQGGDELQAEQTRML